MDNNRKKALSLWASMDGFWNLVVNKEEINNAWQTMYACVEQIDSLYAAYGKLSVIHMPDTLTINNVVFDIYAPEAETTEVTTTTQYSRKYIVAIEKLMFGSPLSDIVSIPRLLTEIQGSIEYVEGVDYNIYRDDNDIAIEWTTEPPEDNGTYYAPIVLIPNTRIDQFGGMHWDLALKSAGLDIGRRKSVYHSLLLSNKAYPTVSDIRNTLNIVAGTEYAKYRGKIHKTSSGVSITYVNELYIVRHAGNVYGSETENMYSGISISGRQMSTSPGSIAIRDVMVMDTIMCTVIKTGEDNVATINATLPYGIYKASIDGGKNYNSVTVNGNILSNMPYASISQMLKVGDTIIVKDVSSMALSVNDATGEVLMDTFMPPGAYSLRAYSPVSSIFNDSYAVKGDSVYSCYYDDLPSSGPYMVSQALNYEIGKGFRETNETYICDPEECHLPDGEYVEIYTPITDIVNIYGWVQTGEAGIADDAFHYDNYVMLNYMQHTGEWYIKNDVLGDHDLHPGDTMIAHVGYYMEYPAEFPDPHTIIVSGTHSGVVDMYGNAIDVIVNFKELDSLTLTDTVTLSTTTESGTTGDVIDSNRCSVTILSGSYDEYTDTYTLTTLEDISLGSSGAVLQPFNVRHKHTIISVNELSGDVITDRTVIYGEYAPHCSVAVRRCMDDSLRKHIFTTTSATVNDERTQCTLELSGDRGVLSAKSPDVEGSTTALIWSNNVNAAAYPVISIDDGDITIAWDADTDVDESTLIGASLLYAGGMYTRTAVHVTSTNHDADIVAIIGKLSELMLPKNTSITVHQI